MNAQQHTYKDCCVCHGLPNAVAKTRKKDRLDGVKQVCICWGFDPLD